MWSYMRKPYDYAQGLFQPITPHHKNEPNNQPRPNETNNQPVETNLNVPTIQPRLNVPTIQPRLNETKNKPRLNETKNKPLGTSLNGPMNKPRLNETKNKPLGTSLNGPKNQPRLNGTKNKNHLKTQQSYFNRMFTRKLNKISEENKQRSNINKASNQNKNQLIPKFLSKFCPDSSECLMIGKHQDLASQFFEGFRKLTYLKQYEIINSGANGTIFKIKFFKKDYTSYGVIKIAAPFKRITFNSIKHEFFEGVKIKQPLFGPDNMIYEYLVGLYLNRYKSLLPNFLETYQLLEFNDFNTYKKVVLQMKKTPSNKMKKTPSNELNVDDLKQNLLPLDYETVLDDSVKLQSLLSSGCKPAFGIDKFKKGYTYALMTQYVKNPVTIREILSNVKGFANYHLIYILFQIYFSLSQLNEKFVHHDLHDENILLYQPYPDGYIEYIYHLDNKVIQFKSPYIVKIIDYGRSFMEKYSKEVKKYISTAECTGNNAAYSGYNLQNSYESVYMDYNSPNVSHDLRLLDMIRSIYKPKELIINSILSKVIYNQEIKDKSDMGMGTSPNPITGYPNTINNVIDAFKSLTDGVQSSLDKNYNTIPSKYRTKRAEMRVYGLHKPYEFKEVKK